MLCAAAAVFPLFPLSSTFEIPSGASYETLSSPRTLVVVVSLPERREKENVLMCETVRVVIVIAASEPLSVIECKYIV